MKTGIFTVYDTKTAAYLPPFFMQTKPAAIRAITDCVNDPEHQFAKHPEDYILFYLGMFDDQNALYVMEQTPVSLAGCHELKSQDQS